MNGSGPSGSLSGSHEVDPHVTQARLAAIIESSDDAIVSKNLDGIIISWNKGAEKIFGYTADEVIGRHITIIIPPDRLDEEPRILQRIRAGERVDHFETIRRTKDGRLIDVSVTISPIHDSSGHIVGASKIARDVTLQKQFQKQLHAAKKLADDARASAEEAREAAEQASRAKDHFLSVLSHELRTPLTPVLAAVSMMRADPSLPQHLVEQVAMIRRNVETEARLVDDLLDLTRIARGKISLHFEVVDAHALVRSVVTMFEQQMAEKGLTITLALRARQYHIWADPGRFQQILLNLMSNAVKFTPEDGTVTVRTSNEGSTLVIETIDTGTGIEAQLMPRLFEPFEQGEQVPNRQFGGLGLGLSIVKSLVEMHKGSISATSEGRNKGATFALHIETVRPPELAGTGAATGANAGTSPRSALTIAGHSCRVLLVEDHPDTRRMLALLLKGLGCEVTDVGSVREAIDAANQHNFNLLVSDIGLPDGTGLDVMRQLAARHGQKLKAIALSGYGQDDDIRRSRDAGFITHLIKPVNMQVLEEAIRKATG